MCRAVSDIEQDDGAICYRRAVFSGMALRLERIDTPVHVVTVDPTAVQDPINGAAADVVPFHTDIFGDDGVRFVELRRAESTRPDLAVADCSWVQAEASSQPTTLM